MIFNTKKYYVYKKATIGRLGEGKSFSLCATLTTPEISVGNSNEFGVAEISAETPINSVLIQLKKHISLKIGIDGKFKLNNKKFSER